MAFDDETVDVAVGCTFDLYIQQNSANECLLLIKSTCYKTFVILADLGQAAQDLMVRI